MSWLDACLEFIGLVVCRAAHPPDQDEVLPTPGSRCSIGGNEGRSHRHTHQTPPRNLSSTLGKLHKLYISNQRVIKRLLKQKDADFTSGDGAVHIQGESTLVSDTIFKNVESSLSHLMVASLDTANRNREAAA